MPKYEFEFRLSRYQANEPRWHTMLRGLLRLGAVLGIVGIFLGIILGAIVLCGNYGWLAGGPMLAAFLFGLSWLFGHD